MTYILDILKSRKKKILKYFHVETPKRKVGYPSSAVPCRVQFIAVESRYLLCG